MNEKRYRWQVTSVIVYILVIFVALLWLLYEPGYEPVTIILLAIVPLISHWQNPSPQYALFFDIVFAIIIVSALLFFAQPYFVALETEPIRVRPIPVTVSAVDENNSTVITNESTPSTDVKIFARFDRERIYDGIEAPKSISNVNGTFQNIPEEYELWIVAESGEKCYPMDKGVELERPTGIWRHPEINFPKAGQVYLLSLVVAEATALETLRMGANSSEGFLCSAIQLEKLETISITVAQE